MYKGLYIWEEWNWEQAPSKNKPVIILIHENKRESVSFSPFLVSLPFPWYL